MKWQKVCPQPNMTGGLLRRRATGRQTHAGRSHVMKAGIGSMRRKPRIARKAPEARKGKEGFLCGFQREHGPADLLVSDFCLPEL